MDLPLLQSKSGAHDVVCVGGGVMGLLTACTLRRRGHTIAVIDKAALGREASWAGAGILSPAPPAERAESELDRLRAFSFAEFPNLARELRETVAVDVGYRRCGGIRLAFSGPERNDLTSQRQEWQCHQIFHEPLDRQRLAELEPNLHRTDGAACWLPDTCQVRNPRLLGALMAQAERLGVSLIADRPVVGFDCCCRRVLAVHCADGTSLRCGAVCVTAGAWSGGLLAAMGLEIPVHPVQGQIVAFQTPGNLVRHVVEVGKRYLVPREDGLVLVGSTEEDVGFDKHTTEEGIAGLRAFACELFPSLAERPVAATWAGLRPGCRLGRPIIDRAPGWDNLWLAAGHFREGIQLSIGTARLLADRITGCPSIAHPEAFAWPSQAFDGEAPAQRSSG